MRKVSVISVVLVAALMFFVSCAKIPRTTRTSVIHDVKIAEKLSVESLNVKPGDEVRWVNYRIDSATIEFTDNIMDALNCNNGFTTLFGKVKTSVNLKAGESASLCFAKTGLYKYNVRAVANVPGGETIMPAHVHVGTQ